MNSFKYYRTVASVLLIVIALFSVNSFSAPYGCEIYEMELSCPYWYMMFNRAGYMDITYWYPSQRHPYYAHEMMTGDWAAAVYYDGINITSEAEWLTNWFEVPDFYTNQHFTFGNKSVSNDPCNPVWTDPNQPSEYTGGSQYQCSSAPWGDTGISDINDGKLEVEIHYEVADLGEYGWSPMTLIDANNSVYVKSERYVLLQTYIFKNIHTTENITDLEFYQMLHGHPTGTYPIDTYAAYETALIDDVLADYTPYDQNHQTENFRYDITLWNDPEYASGDHIDYMGFSSTIEPNDIGFNYFTSGTSGMAEDIIENRNLNGRTSWYDDDMAGAMMWYLPNLAPGESTSITLALMYGTENIPYPTILTKANADPNNDCVKPFLGAPFEDNYLTYDICYDANGYALYDVNIVDHLPLEVDYYSSTPAGDYNSTDHTVTWSMGDLANNASGCIELKTKVNFYSRPGGSFSNFVQITSDEGVLTAATTDVNVCYDGYGTGIIYVDKDATGYGNGTSWDNAYTNLQDALANAANGGSAVTAVWVAAGTYKPVESTSVENYSTYRFELLEGVALFGHFGGVGTYETSPSQRDFSDANNTTILDGQIGMNYYDAVGNIFYAEDIDNAAIDGFTIKGAYEGAGIYMDNSDVSIVNCKILSNRYYGVRATNYSYPDIHNCLFLGNTSQAINISNYCWPEISYCTFDGNETTSDGLYFGNSVVVVDDSIFEDHLDNGIESSDGTLYISDCSFTNNDDSAIQISDVTTTVTNCLIEDCGDDGIYANDSDLTIKYTVIDNSFDNAIYATGGCNLELENSVIRLSGESGLEIYGNFSTIIRNNWIHNNGTDQSTYYHGAGIWFNNQVSVPLIRNNTIYDNYTYGIQSSEYGADPNILNCIIYANDTNDFYRENGTFDTVNYCNLQNSYSGTGNITGDPCFKNPLDPYDFHLDEYSQCKDAGKPDVNYTDLDIDGENRIYYGRVDIGADEYYWSVADFDEDGIVNFKDYTTFAAAWDTNSNDGNYNPDCDLAASNAIDTNDLFLFCQDWLWEKGWDQPWMLTAGTGGSTLESMSMMMASSFLFIEMPVVQPEAKSDALALSVNESISKMPQRLAAKSQKFYDITAESVANTSVRPKPLTPRQQLELQIEMLEWLDELWQTGELSDAMTKKEYLEFRNALENSWTLQ